MPKQLWLQENYQSWDPMGEGKKRSGAPQVLEAEKEWMDTEMVPAVALALALKRLDERAQVRSVVPHLLAALRN